MADSVAKQLGLQIIGSILDTQEQIYAVTSERRIKHPAAAAISEAANSISRSFVNAKATTVAVRTYGEGYRQSACSAWLCQQYFSE